MLMFIHKRVCTRALLFSGDDDGGASSLPVLLQRHVQTEQVLGVLKSGQKGQPAIGLVCHSESDLHTWIHKM